MDEGRRRPFYLPCGHLVCRVCRFNDPQYWGRVSHVCPDCQRASDDDAAVVLSDPSFFFIRLKRRLEDETFSATAVASANDAAFENLRRPDDWRQNALKQMPATCHPILGSKEPRTATARYCTLDSDQTGHVQPRYPAEDRDMFGRSSQISPSEDFSELTRASAHCLAAGSNGFERAPSLYSAIGSSESGEALQTHPVEGPTEFEQISPRHHAVGQNEQGQVDIPATCHVSESGEVGHFPQKTAIENPREFVRVPTTHQGSDTSDLKSDQLWDPDCVLIQNGLNTVRKSHSGSGDRRILGQFTTAPVDQRQLLQPDLGKRTVEQNQPKRHDSNSARFPEGNPDSGKQSNGQGLLRNFDCGSETLLRGLSISGRIDVHANNVVNNVTPDPDSGFSESSGEFLFKTSDLARNVAETSSSENSEKNGCSTMTSASKHVEKNNCSLAVTSASVTGEKDGKRQ